MHLHKLSKNNILKRNKEFQQVYKTGKSYANKFLVMYVLPSNMGKLRVGFAAGKRLGNAVVRNRVKRLLREAYRLNKVNVADSESIDIIIVGRKPIVNVKYSEVAKAYVDVCRRARLLK